MTLQYNTTEELDQEETWYRMEPLRNPLDLFHISIWEGAHLEKITSIEMIVWKFKLDRSEKSFTLSVSPVSKNFLA